MTDILAAERAYLVLARAELKRMRERTQALLDGQKAWGNDELTTRALTATLARRFDQLLDDGVTPLFFGRLDQQMTREVFHVGRRHVTGSDGEPVVVDWRAPVSEPFYRASATDPMGVELRRRFGFRDGVLTGYEDDRLDRPASTSALLVEDIERPRTGPMRDIVASIQPEQDVLVRAALSDTLCVQGAPGTGKTAVGLHRAAYLLYAHRQRLATGVLVVGPNRAFLSYVQEVLPALGEVQVTQATAEDLAPQVPISGADRDEVAVLKGDARMAAVLANALWLHVVRPQEPIVHVAGTRRWRVQPEQVHALERAVRARGLAWTSGRAALAGALAGQLVRAKEDAGSGQPHDAVERLARSREVRAYVDAAWPPVTPTALVTRVLTDPDRLARAARGVLTEAEQAILLRSPGRRRWTRADLPLLDEAAHLIDRQDGYAHIVLDEAQDLSPMQLRAVGRRCRTGSATVLGDLAQATTPWACADWTEVLHHLGKPDGIVVALTTGYRVPRDVLDLANRLLPVIAPALPAATSLRHVEGALTVCRVADVEQLLRGAVGAVQDRSGLGSVAVVSDDPELLAAVAVRLPGAEHLADAGPSARVTLVPTELVKGLEFDHVVLLEPGSLPLRLLYVALTRAVTSLTVLHRLDLPSPL